MASVGVQNTIPRSAAMRGNASRNWKMPDSAGCMPPKTSRLRQMLTICSSAGVAATQSMYLSAVRGYASQDVSEKWNAMSSESLALRMRILSLGAEAAL